MSDLYNIEGSAIQGSFEVFFLSKLVAFHCRNSSGVSDVVTVFIVVYI